MFLKAEPSFPKFYHLYDIIYGLKGKQRWPNVFYLKLATAKISAWTLSYKHAMGNSSTKAYKRGTCGF